MRETVILSLTQIALALVSIVVPTLTILMVRREQNKKMDNQDEVLEKVATKASVDEVHDVVNSAHAAALKEIVELKKEVIRLNTTSTSTPVTETPSKVTVADGVVTVEPNGHAVEVVSEIPPAQPAPVQPPVAE